MTDTAYRGAVLTDYRVLAEFQEYAHAQELVDRLSDRGFPVENVRIVGTGIRSVEQVTGRRTKGRAAAGGAAAGAWFGLFIGLLFSLFVIAGPWSWLSMVVTSAVIGAVFGAVFGFLGHWSTGGRRDFSSASAFQATQYQVEVAAGYREEAARAAAAR
ncbi:general stress protein [Georgenia sp. AZ-5]|uniref:general stress protein n=1 Tax=Georgenia sp. AZ-5 TaxID=3367526 RepID=UPI00375413CF